jgi:hypothetical protein
MTCRMGTLSRARPERACRRSTSAPSFWIRSSLLAQAQNGCVVRRSLVHRRLVPWLPAPLEYRGTTRDFGYRLDLVVGHPVSCVAYPEFTRQASLWTLGAGTFAGGLVSSASAVPVLMAQLGAVGARNRARANERRVGWRCLARFSRFWSSCLGHLPWE